MIIICTVVNTMKFLFKNQLWEGLEVVLKATFEQPQRRSLIRRMVTVSSEGRNVLGLAKRGVVLISGGLKSCIFPLLYVQ